MNVYCIYPAESKSPKQLPNCLKITQTSVVLIVFNCVTCDVGTCTVTVSVALHESGTRNALLGTRLNNTEVYLTPLSKSHNCRIINVKLNTPLHFLKLGYVK